MADNEHYLYATHKLGVDFRKSAGVEWQVWSQLKLVLCCRVN